MRCRYGRLHGKRFTPVTSISRNTLARLTPAPLLLYLQVSDLFHAAEIGSDLSLTSSAGNLSRGSRFTLRLRAILRLTRRRRPSLMALALATGFVLSAASLTAPLVWHQVQTHSKVEPLAPAPMPPAAPMALTRQRHPLLSRLRTNPLRGLASWYGDVWNGRPTASGEIFDETKLTAAHKSLPLGTLVRVTDTENSRSVVVKINDRGTLAPNRVIDLSSAAAKELGIIEQGLAHVKLEVLKKKNS